MQVPYLDEENVILAMVHHIHINDKTKAELLSEKDEKTFVCVLALNGDDIKVLLGQILVAYQENAYLEESYQENAKNPAGQPQTDPSSFYAGITPKIFIAAVLKFYGFKAAKRSIQSAFTSLARVDSILENADWELLRSKSSTGELREKCDKLNKELQGLSQKLTGVRSRVHYIGLCARGMMREDSETKKYIIESWYRALCSSRKGKISLLLPCG